jgi:exoribonuclease R
MNAIPAILVLQDNKIFGKVKNKYYYKCIPNSKDYHQGLVLYNIKQIGWGKHYKNKFVIVKETELVQNKHPVYSIVHTIGDVDELSNFYNYNLQCKNVWFNDLKQLNDSVKKVKYQQKEKGKEDIINLIECKENRISKKIISIDPKGSLDIDDAVGIVNVDGNTILSIYIANVPMYIEALNSYNRKGASNAVSVWKMLSKQISTIYLPNGKRTMIPSLLSDNFCSLLEGENRLALSCDITIKVNKDDSVSIVDISFINCKVCVLKNYDYEDKSLEKDDIYINVKNIVEKLNVCGSENAVNYFESETTFDSHTVIEYLMLFMNHHAAKYLCESSKMSKSKSIYRCLCSTYPSKSSQNENLPKNVKQFVRGWNSNGGGKYSITPSPHDFLKLDVYTHITSPIRRQVDLLNSIELQKRLNLFSFTDEAIEFYNEHMKDENINELNRQMKDIRKCQTECNLLSFCVNDKSVLGKEYQGYICDKTILENGKTSYLVYINDLNMVCNYKCSPDLDTLNIYEGYLFKLYHFKDKSNFKEKIRIDIF